MKIAFVSDAIYPYSKGGKEMRLNEISTRLAEFGYDVHIYTMKWWDGPKDRVNKKGVHLHGIGKRHDLYVKNRRSIKEGVFFGLACFKLITKRFDVIDVDHMPYFPLFSVKIVCLIRRKKMIATWHEVWGKKYWRNYLGGTSGYVGGLIESISVKLPNTIISISPHTTHKLASGLNRKKRVITVPVGVDYDKITLVKPSETRSDLIYAGRLHHHKRIDLVLHAVSEMKKQGVKTSCIIVGEGPEKHSLINMSKQLNISDLVTFHDFYERQESVFALIKSSRVFVFPSEREGFGMVAVEANACGKPVVTSLAPNNAARALVTHGENGYHFKHLNKRSVSLSVISALNEVKKLELKCRVAAKQFDWDPLIKKMRKVYDS